MTFVTGSNDTLFLMNHFFITEDDVQKIVSVSIDGKESKLIFIDHAYSEMSVRDLRIIYLSIYHLIYPSYFIK